MDSNKKLAIIGAGNIGLAIAKGLVRAKLFTSGKIYLTRRKLERISEYADEGFILEKNNSKAVKNSDIIIIAVEPQQVDPVLDEIKNSLDSQRHSLISVVTGITIKQIQKRVGDKIDVVRAMPNTAIAINEAMTCLASANGNSTAMKEALEIFSTVGKALSIDEDQMGAATALGACGIAFFLRTIRAASQGGIEIGFHADKALQIAAQTAKGAATLLLVNEQHPEYEIDKVTTPRGVTISGLNQMEHEGLSSAMIKGIVTSATKAAKLYSAADKEE
ncbi:MAG: pyrroline-5-carboxylate reductase [Calditrichaceae bacterium]|jgi:pyrroline-5-carboxylate reductase